MQRKVLGRDHQDMLFSAALILPALLITFIFILLPVIDSVFKSFLAYKVKNIISGTPGTWNQFANYIKLFNNDKLIPAVQVTFLFVVSTVLLQFILGFALAMLLNSNLAGSRIFRSVMMIPWVVPTVISALIWMWIFQPQYGLLKFLVAFFTGGHITEFAILNNPKTALSGVILAALWKQIPLTTLLLLAGLQNIPQDLMEAATVDGASGVNKFFAITLPHMRSVIRVVLTMAIIDNFKQFPLFWTMTGGGPQNSTTTLAILSYREAFVSNNLGSGAAVTTVWMVLMMLVVFIYQKLIGSSEVD